MKTLPDSPSLDHLRQQAKDVLTQMRAIRPEATLSDAQAHVAEQYGYRTWPDLKAEVDRRCGSAEAHADDAIGAAVAAMFELGEPRGPMTGPVQQWAGHAWVLTTDRGRWLARRLVEWFDESAVEAEARLANAASDAGILTPIPVRSRGGQLVVSLNGSKWRVYTLPVVGPEPTTPADPRYAAAAGRILGKVHALRLNPAHPVVPWLTCVRPESQWRALHEAAVSQGKPWADRLEEVIPTIMDASSIVENADAAGDAVLSGCHYAPTRSAWRAPTTSPS